jgi:hypothetical protein
MKSTPNDSKNNDLYGLKHQAEYLDFIEWIATPSASRKPKTQQELAKKFRVGQDTLSEWKQRNDFWKNVAQKRRQWGQERTPDVIMALYNRILKTGSAQEVKLWLQYFEDWSENNPPVFDPLKRKYGDLTDAELDERIKKAKDHLLKR